MSTYAIGDIQGCVDALHRLLGRLNFNPDHDRVWFVGDLVNRGPNSLDVLRFIKELGEAAVTVLGNHDLHLLAIWTDVTQPGRKDTLHPILSAPDRDELLHWLRHRPLLHVEQEFVMVHAGFLPSWSIPTAQRLAGEVEESLRSPQFKKFLPSIYFRKGRVPSPEAALEERLSFTTNVMTRLRVCTKEGIPEFSFKGPPQDAPKGHLPWFRVPGRAAEHATIVFGHWSALGILNEQTVIALDGGCVWGRELVALRLEDRQLFRVPCPSG